MRVLHVQFVDGRMSTFGVPANFTLPADAMQAGGWLHLPPVGAPGSPSIAINLVEARWMSVMDEL